jgi:16S rRNA (adenine1518-N6/adenine1519-N6)-dimethyltransferase
MYSKIKLDKSLGQNFLIKGNYAEKLIQYVNKDESIIEIGPGNGAITEKLITKTKNILCIEKDIRFIPILNEKFPKTSVILEDILKYDLSSIPYTKFSLVSALPYYISKDIISLFLKGSIRAKNIYVILQKEVAQKYTTEGEKLFNTLKIYAKDIEKGDIIKKENFIPVPKVDSQIIYIKNIYNFDKEQKELESYVNIGFSSPRKKLGNVIKGDYLGKFKEKRAQNLTFNDWVELYRRSKEQSYS